MDRLTQSVRGITKHAPELRTVPKIFICTSPPPPGDVSRYAVEPMPDDLREQILDLIAQAETAIPDELLPNLPPGRHTSGEPEFHSFENSIWQIGERIRQLLLKKTSLRNDETLQSLFLRISVNPNAKRGRQSFIMLLGHKSCRQHASGIASQITDKYVSGHVIGTLLKMQAADFATEVSTCLDADKAWIRNKANIYCKRYGNTA